MFYHQGLVSWQKENVTLLRCIILSKVETPSSTIYFVPASQIWELGKLQSNTMEFAEAIDNSDLESFGFSDDFIFELWGAVTDAKAGRLNSNSNGNQNNHHHLRNFDEQF